MLPLYLFFGQCTALLHIMMDKLFGRRKSPEESTREWTRQLAREQRKVEHEIRKMKIEEKNLMRHAKAAGKVGDPVAVRTLARQVLRTRQAIKRLYLVKTHMSSVAMQLQHQVAQAKMTGTLQKSADLMRAMNSMLRVDVVREVAVGLSREMSKAGLMDELIQEKMDDLDDVEEEELDAEVAKVVDDVMQTQLVGTRVTAAGMPATSVAAPEPVAEESDDELMNKYQALKGQV